MVLKTQRDVYIENAISQDHGRSTEVSDGAHSPAAFLCQIHSCML